MGKKKNKSTKNSSNKKNLFSAIDSVLGKDTDKKAKKNSNKIPNFKIERSAVDKTSNAIAKKKKKNKDKKSKSLSIADEAPNRFPIKKAASGIKYTVKINNRNTSVLIRYNIISLFCLVHSISKQKNQFIQEFLNQIIVDYDPNKSMEGISEWVTNKVIESTLEKEDSIKFRKIFNKLTSKR